VQIPFKLYDGFAVVIRGAIGNQENLNFLVDTGAVPSAIHQRLKRQLNLNGLHEDISVINQSTSVERVELPILRLGPLKVKPLSVVVVDLTSIEVRLGVRLDAVVGLDVLGRQDFVIDYAKHMIRLGASDVNGQAVPFELRTQAGAPYVVIPIEVNSHALWVLLDTGTDGLSLFQARLQGRLPALKKSGVGQEVNAGGAHTVQLAEVSTLRLGGKTWSNLSAVAVAVPSVSALRDFDGMLGPASLHITRMAFNFGSNALYLEFNR
jgi:hypothetical protein